MHNYSDTKISKYTFAEGGKITASVVGARGYSGIETARILLSHPRAELTHCFATGDFKLSDYLASEKAKAVVCLKDTEIMQNLTDVVFLATPAEVSLELAPKILKAGKKVIDLSGAFWLKNHSYKEWYGFEHTQKTLLSQAQYGLAPWVGPAGGKEKLVANPGCYATAITMALIPLLKMDLIDAGNIVIDAKSGTSGAGRKATESIIYGEVDGECLPYKVGKHQHYPEIVEALERFGGKTIEAHFSTSLLPVRRGIIAAIYGKTNATSKEIESAFQTAYGENPLVSFGELTKNPGLASLKKVVGTARTHISWELKGNKLYVFSCIDNLLKGAAGQAVENFNRLCDLPSFTGLNQMEALI